MSNATFDFSTFLKDYEKRIGRSLSIIEIEKAKKIYSNIIDEHRKMADKKSASAFLSNDEKNTAAIEKGFNEFENYMLSGVDKLMEETKKKLEDDVVTINQGKRVNLKYPGRVHIIAADRGGEVIEINNKKDVEHQTMAYRFDTIKDQASSAIKAEQREGMEFE